MTLPRADLPYAHRTETCRTCGAECVTVLNYARTLIAHRERADPTRPMCRDKEVYVDSDRGVPKVR